ncbi:MAG: hypothetical protein ABI137_14285 [Antricoccus sp.]
MDANTEAIIALAWARDLALAEDTFSDAATPVRKLPTECNEVSLLSLCVAGLYVDLCHLRSRRTTSGGRRLPGRARADCRSLSLLTSPDCRRKGLGRQIHNVAINDALYEGLVPQSRSHVLNHALRKLARGSGFIGENREIRIQLARE